MAHILQILKKDRYAQIATTAFVLLTIWWILLYISGSKEGSANLLYGAVYGPFMSGFGGFLGLKFSRKWGGMKSLMGKAIIVLSLGLLAQFFGQVVFSTYNIVLGIDIPYPSLADLGFFGNIPFYFFGVVYVAKASGVQVNMKKLGSQVQVVAIPLVMIIITYIAFLQEYEFADTPALTVFLDFAYPLGQALYVSIAMFTFSLSYKILGGVMRGNILLILLALVAQYLADFNFLLQNINGSWYNAGYGDYIYLVAYFLMTLALIHMRMVHVRGKLSSQ